jgi:PAS domain S-box-containing protein
MKKEEKTAKYKTRVVTRKAGSLRQSSAQAARAEKALKAAKTGKAGPAEKVLRKAAEKITREETAQKPLDISKMSPAQIKRALHELRVYQIELNIQNEELKSSQVELEASRESYFELYNLAPVGYITISEKGFILKANLTAATLLGCTKSTLENKLFSLFIITEDQDIYYRHRSELSKTHQAVAPQVCELRMVKKDGTAFWGQLVTTCMQDDKGAPVLRSVLTNITESRKAEQAIQDSEKKFRLAFENSRDAIIWADSRTGIIVDCNSATTELFEKTQGEIVGSHQSSLHPAEKAEFYREMFADQSRDMRSGVEAEIITGKGTIKTATISVSNTEFEGQKIIQGVFHDITSRKRAEEERRGLEERLIRAEKFEALGLLAGGVAHDLNNVLGIVVGYAELLLNVVDEKNPLRKDVVTIMEGGQRASIIVDDLLAMARRGVVGRKILNLNQLINDFKKSPGLGKILSYHPFVQIQTDLEPDLLNISGSSVHLEKTLYNLVSNACEAMVNGGTLTIKTTNQYIDKPISGYDTISEGDYVVLSVSDEGEGISANNLKRIFEPFYTKKIMGRSGTGLGLPVVWGTVKDHNGYIDVVSLEGKGSTFRLYFLVSREDIADEALTISVSEYVGNGQSILVVDDVEDQRNLAARILKLLNYNVSCVASGEDAIKYLKEHKADLLVLDMIMDPGMDGLDTYRGVLKINPKQKAIIVSGFSESDRVRDAQALGAGAYIKKPYVIEKIGLAVKKELEGKR